MSFDVEEWNWGKKQGVEINSFLLDQVPAFESTAGDCLFESNAIAQFGEYDNYFVSYLRLCKKPAAKISRFCNKFCGPLIAKPCHKKQVIAWQVLCFVYPAQMMGYNTFCETVHLISYYLAI